jgi:hypothetical protein
MKTIKKIQNNETEYKRVEDEYADYAVKHQGWSFCPKSEWKLNVRDAAAIAVAEAEEARKAAKKEAKLAEKTK